MLSQLGTDQQTDQLLELLFATKNTDQAVNLLHLELTRLGRKTEEGCKTYSLLLHYYRVVNICQS